MAAAVERLHTDVARLRREGHKERLNHHHGAVDDDTEIDGTHRQQVGAHAAEVEGNEGKEQGQRNDRSHDDRRTPVFHEQQHHESDEDDALENVVHHGAHGQVDEVLAVVERHYLHVLGQVIVLYLRDFRLQGFDDLLGVLALTHDDDAFYDIILLVAAHLSEAWRTTLMDGGEVAHEDGRTTDVLHHDVANLAHVVDESDAAHHVGLRTTLDDVAADIDVAVGNGLIKFERTHAVGGKLIGVDADLESLHLTAEADDVGNARHRPELALNDPVLQRLQLTHRTLVAAQRIAENLTRRPR